jgi:hypothetical protein
MKVGTVLAAVAVLFVAGVAMADDAKPTSRGIYGQIVSVAADGNIVVKVNTSPTESKEVTVTTDAKTVVTLDGKDAKVADLKKDMWAMVQPSEGTATKIVATAEKPVVKAPPAGAAPGGAIGGAQNPTLVPKNPG